MSAILCAKILSSFHVSLDRTMFHIAAKTSAESNLAD